MRRITHRPWRGQATADPPAPLVAGPVVLDRDARRALVTGRVVHLPAGEAVILEVLMRSPGRVLPARELLAATGDQLEHTAQLRRLVRRLSRRLAINPLLPRLIERIGPDGYRFTPIP
jgi:DNA-binding response OmpR family regulator